LFDLDGTLLDSIEGIVASFAFALDTHMPGHPYTRHDLIMKIGEPLPVQMQQLARGDAALASRMVASYREHNRRLLPTFELYPDVALALDALSARGFRLGLVTSKARASAAVSLERHDLARRFPLVMTSDDTARHKPDPMPLTVAAARLGLDPAEILYVGDSVHDVNCAHGAGCIAAAALWGPFDPEDLKRLAPRYLVRSMLDLLGIDILQR
jgi:pyrophosphatase PpaX